jgi:hypothetical protein
MKLRNRSGSTNMPDYIMTSNFNLRIQKQARFHCDVKHVRFGPTNVPDFTKKQHYPSILCMFTILSVFQCYYYTIKP